MLIYGLVNAMQPKQFPTRPLPCCRISILVSKVKEARVQTIIEKLTVMTSAKDDALRDVASLGVFRMLSKAMQIPSNHMLPLLPDPQA